LLRVVSDKPCMRNLNITFPLLLLLLAAPVWAQKSFTVGEIKSLSKQQQVAVLKAYQEFIHIQSAGDYAPDDERLTSLRFSFLPLAYASGKQDCFFAGWPSSSRTVSSKGKKRKVCSFPKKAGSCGSQSMQCQPVLFGTDLCVSTATQKDRNSAFAQCEQKFQKSGRKLEDVAAKISSGELAAEADELFALVDQVCQNGFQARFGMCRTLEKKVADIRELKKDQPEEIKAEPE